jgi:hypothetical protein
MHFNLSCNVEELKVQTIIIMECNKLLPFFCQSRLLTESDEVLKIMKTKKSLPTSMSIASCNEDGEATQVSSRVVMMTARSFTFTYLDSNVFAIIRRASKEKKDGHDQNQHRNYTAIKVHRQPKGIIPM